MIFTMSIEPLEGSTYWHGFHLGTIEKVARDCVEDHWKAGGFRSLGLMLDGDMFDVFDGDWANAMADKAMDEIMADREEAEFAAKKIHQGGV